VIGFLIRRLPRRYLEAFAPAALRLYSITLRGDAVECPVCEHTFDRFLSYGHLRARKNALCPRCLSLERHRLLWLYLKNRTDFFSHRLDVLHVAPERCFVKRFEAVHTDGYVTADLESPLADLRVDVQDLPFSDESFDVVLCNHVLEHVVDDRRATSELHRVLRSDGWAILQSPMERDRDVTYEDPSVTTPAEREKAFGQRDHLRIYGLDYPRRLADAGFRVDEHDLGTELGQAATRRYALPPGEIIFLCRR